MPDNFQPSKRVEADYAREIYRLLRRSFTRKPGEPVALLSPAEFFVRYAEQAARRMITYLYVGNARNWKEAARKSGQGRMIYEALQRELSGPVGARIDELTRQNAELISSLPQKLAEEATRKAAQYEFEGERASEFAKEKIFEHLSRSRAMLIARTEVSKASTALTQARSEDLGIRWYVWETSQDQRVRLSHRKMQGVLVRFDDPPSPEALAHESHAPSPYNAGNIWNCRCYPAPLLRFDQVAWPHKVFYANRIQSMTLARFRQLNGSQAAIAA